MDRKKDLERLSGERAIDGFHPYFSGGAKHAGHETSNKYL
jgi:hypothetical protein